MAEIDLLIEGASAPAEPDSEDAGVPLAAGPASPGRATPGCSVRTGCIAAALSTKTAFGELMGEGRAAMVFTDPPYNVPIDGNVGGLGAIRHREFVMAWTA